MRIEVLPSLTVGTVKKFQYELRRFESFAPVIHVDLMDGRFVSTRSVSAAQLVRQTIRRPIEAHCMLASPADWLPALSRLPLRRVILHVELGPSLLPLLAWFRSRQVDIGLAIKPSTHLKTVWRWVPYVHSLQVMGVDPGRYGAPFHPSTTPRLAYLHRRYPGMTLACDGGLNIRNIPAVVKAGARRLVIGSDIQQASHPAAEYRRLQVIARAAAAVVH